MPMRAIDGVESVSGKVSGRAVPGLGMIALALAMLGISIYIWVRFEWQFGIGALFALAARRDPDARACSR